MIVGDFGGSIGESSVLMVLLGAAILIGTGVGSWRIMLSSVIGLIAGALVLNLADIATGRDT